MLLCKIIFDNLYGCTNVFEIVFKGISDYFEI